MALLCAAAKGTGQAGLHNPQYGFEAMDPESASRASFRGMVAEGLTGEPLVAAQVFLVGSDVGALTNRLGEFALDAPGPGDWTVVVHLIGYRQEVATVSVEANSRAVVRVGLESLPLSNCGLVIRTALLPPPRVRLSILTEAGTPPDTDVEVSIRSGVRELDVAVNPGDVGGYLEIDVTDLDYWEPLTVSIQSDDFEAWLAENIRLVADDPCELPPISPVILATLNPRRTP